MKHHLHFPILVLVCVLGSFGNARAASTVRHWTGNGTGNAWRTAANWSNNVAPVAGDYLIFPSGAAARSNFNNFASGTVFNGIEINSGGYVLAGNLLALTNQLKMGASLISGSSRILCPLTLQTASPHTWTIGGNSTLFLDGIFHYDLLPNSGFQLIQREGSGTLVFNNDIVDHSSDPDRHHMIQLRAGKTVLASGATYTSTNPNVVVGDLANRSGYLLFRGDGGPDGVELQVQGSCVLCQTDDAALTGTGPFGVVSGITDVFGFATLSPGLGGPGKLTLMNMGSWDGRFDVDLRGQEPGSGYDQVEIQGGATASPYDLIMYKSTMRINRDPGYAPPVGQVFRIFNVLPASSHFHPNIETGNIFLDFPYPGATYTTNGYTYQLRWDAGDGNDVELQVVRKTNSNFSIWNAASSNNAYFAIADNWVADAEPAPGHHMHFTPYVAKSWPALTNNFVAGRHAGSLFFSGEDYRIDGDAITLDGGITNVAAHGTNTLTTPLTISAGQVFHSQYFDGPLRLSGVIGGSTSELTIQGGGEVQFGGTVANNYRGLTRVNKGTLRLNKSRFGLGGQPVAVPGDLEIGPGVPATVITENPAQWPATSDLRLHPFATLQLRGNAQSAASLTLEGSGVYTEDGIFYLGGPLTNTISAIPSVIEGTFDLLGGNRTFMVFNGAASNDLVFNGMITNGVLVKRGGGRMTVETTGSILDPNSPRMTARTVLDEGGLRLNVLQTSGGVQMNAGVLEASGQVSGLTANAGTFSPGIVGQPGALQVLGALTLNTGVVFHVDINGVTSDSYDRVVVPGSSIVNFNQATLTGTVGFSAPPGATFPIITSGGGLLQGQFAGLPDGAPLVLSGQNFVINYYPTQVILKRAQSAPAITTTSMSKDGEFQFRGVGDPNARYLIQASPDLLPGNWIDLGISSAAASGAFRFDDTNAPLFPRRYYRALTQ